MKPVKTILLIDDDEEDQEIFEVILNDINTSYNCICADTGEDGLELLLKSETLPDYIFLDLNLPFMNGFEFLESVKENSKLQHIPVIIYSTSSRAIDREKALELGAKEYLIKLSSFNEIKDMLKSMIV